MENFEENHRHSKLKFFRYSFGTRKINRFFVKSKVNFYIFEIIDFLVDSLNVSAFRNVFQFPKNSFENRKSLHWNCIIGKYANCRSGYRCLLWFFLEAIREFPYKICSKTPQSSSHNHPYYHISQISPLKMSETLERRHLWINFDSPIAKINFINFYWNCRPQKSSQWFFPKKVCKIFNE